MILRMTIHSKRCEVRPFWWTANCHINIVIPVTGVKGLLFVGKELGKRTEEDVGNRHHVDHNRKQDWPRKAKKRVGGNCWTVRTVTTKVTKDLLEVHTRAWRRFVVKFSLCYTGTQNPSAPPISRHRRSSTEVWKKFFWTCPNVSVKPTHKTSRGFSVCVPAFYASNKHNLIQMFLFRDDWASWQAGSG